MTHESVSHHPSFVLERSYQNHTVNVILNKDWTPDPRSVYVLSRSVSVFLNETVPESPEEIADIHMLIPFTYFREQMPNFARKYLPADPDSSVFDIKCDFHDVEVFNNDDNRFH